MDEYNKRNKKRQSSLEYRQHEHRSHKRRKHSRESSPESPPENEPITWDDHRSTLNKIFFRDYDLIKKGSQEYQDFWIFLKKYQALHKGNHKNEHIASASKTNKLGIPVTYERQHKLNFTITPETSDALMVRGCLFKDDQRRGERTLQQKDVEEFSSVLDLYVDFLQRQKMAKLRKLRAAQSALPIAPFFEKILRTIKDNQVVLVAGDTGCGKSTQVPQYLMSAGFEKIACTQPRRIACISLCKRVSYETLNEYGDQVAYQIRFEKTKTQRTRIIFLTEGLLLRQVSTDTLLSSYDVIILDEVHERHLSCDFLLGVIKCLVKQRSDLKVILMSATINVELFSKYFGDCPVIQVPGRLHPIQVHYQSIPLLERGSRLNPAPYVRILQQIDDKYGQDERGDLLIFLSGITEITTVAEAVQLYAQKTQRWIVMPLHSTLSIAEQDKVFDYAPEGVRKCIISTNIAETSVTIDGVRFVVDSNIAANVSSFQVKEMSYDPSCRMQKLKEFWISRASAEQRKGRAGRTGPGFCYRLYSETEYTELSSYSTPEIQRVPLESILLQMMAMGLPNVRLFPFLEPPPSDSIEEAIQGLKEQGALTENEELTPMGRMLSRLPVDVTFAKMLILGSVFNQLEAMLVLAAALSVQSPFTNKSFRDTDAMTCRKPLNSEHGDPFTLMNAYHEWVSLKSEHGADTRKWCRKRGFEEQRFYEMTKLQRQFRELLQDSGLMERLEKAKEMDASARRQRHGELKKLRSTKTELKKAPRKKKFLKLESGLMINDENEEEDEKIDVQDIEFRIANDFKQVKDLSSRSHTSSHWRLTLLKVMLCSGLYPQTAIGDEHNPHKSDAEQLFHTKSKPFVFLHPTGVFAFQPDLLKLSDSDCLSGPSRQPFSAKHQLLCYVTLLETTKPYLTNCLRVPAAHILLLFGHQLETNAHLTRIICDNWLELGFQDSQSVGQLLAQAILVRDTWHKLLQLRLEEMGEDPDEKDDSPEMCQLRKRLIKNLDDYFRTEVFYTLRRLLPAHLKDAYVGPNQIFDFSNDILGVDQNAALESHPTKGGLLVRDYLNYNCLMELEVKNMSGANQKEWVCPGCGETKVATILEQVRHRGVCLAIHKAEEATTEDSPSSSKSRVYFCHDCSRELKLSATEILKHKRNHAHVKDKI